MLRLATLLLALGVYTGVLAASQGPIPSTAENKSNPPQSQTTQEQQPACDAKRGSENCPFVIKVLGTESNQTQSAKDSGEHEHESSQDGWMIFLTGMLVVAALLQAALIYITIRTTRRQLRAYVFPDSLSLCDGSMLNPPLPAHFNDPGVVTIVKNSGATPAYKVSHWSEIRVIRPQDEHTLTIPPIEERFVSSIGANCIINKCLWHNRVLTPAEIGQIGTGDLAIYVHGRIEYRTFGKKRFTNYRLFYSGIFPPPPGVSFNFCEKGNDAD